MLDCTVYALAAAYHLGMNKFSERDWSRLEDIVQPHTKDLFDIEPDFDDKHALIDRKKTEKQLKTEQKNLAKSKNSSLNPRRNNKSGGFATNW